MDKYCIPNSYKARLNNKHCDKTLKVELWYQHEVYISVYNFMKKHKLKKLIDIGTGCGAKLMKYCSNLETIGYETEPAYSYLIKKYPNKKWVKSGEASKNFGEYFDNCDVIMSADVIEHIVEPDELINFMKKFNTKYFLFSTPCRNKLVNAFPDGPRTNANGPPNNMMHVREWTFEEFKLYLSKYFNIISSHLGKAQRECQWHFCVRKD